MKKEQATHARAESISSVQLQYEKMKNDQVAAHARAESINSV